MIERILNMLGLRPSANLDAVARQVTEDSLAEVCQQVAGRMSGMNFAEARGYVRSRATRIVLGRARTLLDQRGQVDSGELDSIARLATERLVPQVIRQARVGVPVRPATTLLRRAA